MIIKTFLNKIKISKYFYILIILCFITGLIKELSAVIIIILFHEFGHFLISYFYKWDVNMIVIYPFGGLIKYDEVIDKPLFEELLITLCGPLNQWILFIFIFFMKKYSLISDYYYNIFLNYHISIFIFNLLPILPLDGSKIINIILNNFFTFRLSYKLLSFISFIFLFIFIFLFKDNYSYLIIISFLMYEIVKYIKNKKIFFNRFLLEKYLYDNNYKKIIKIDHINKMKRNRKHLIRNNNSYITEKLYIKKEYNS